MTTTELTCIAMEIGALLLENGAEINRVEESMRRICLTYDLESAEVFCVPTTVILTVKAPDEAPVTQIRRIYSRGTDLHKVDELNALSRSICGTRPDYSQVCKAIEGIYSTPVYSDFLQLVAFCCVGFFFTLLFGDSFTDALLSGIICAPVKIILDKMSAIKVNPFFVNITAAFFIGVWALTFFFSGWVSNLDTLIIGTIMTLAPGLAVTNSLRDLIAGDLLSGIAKVIEAFMVGTAIAIGVGIPLIFFQPLIGG